VGWKAFQVINRWVPESQAIWPKWAPRPLLKSYERSKPPLGFPRITDSLCPGCVKEVRNAIINGEADLAALRGTHPGEIKAHLLEKDGQILMQKDCEKHGHYNDVISNDPDFTRRIEDLFLGRDFMCAEDEEVHDHGSSSIKYGRGAVLTVDLTNRCNMMCNPCFMDANQVGYVHEPDFEEIKEILDRGVSYKPKRQAMILFSGGEPTIVPHFLDACRYAKKVGYYSILAATNGIAFAQSKEFCQQAKEAGLDGVYLQFDGASEEANSHRHVGNLFDVKLHAVNNLSDVGIKITLVTTILNGINNDHVGKVVEFAAQNIDKVRTIAFQPVSFTGRDEDIDETTRRSQRYTLSDLTHDLKDQLGELEPMRDWYPLSSFSAFSSVLDMMQGPDADWGWSSCNCHPNCGIFTVLVVNTKTKEWAPLYRFFDYEQFLRDVSVITDTARGKAFTAAQFTLSLLRNLDASKAPGDFPLSAIKNMFQPNTKGTDMKADREGDDLIHLQKATPEWKILALEGMWFQDLFNYDLRRTEMCVIPYGTQEGEISFCAYNTGAGWRQVIENIYMTANTAEWYKEEGRHTVYASQKKVPLPEVDLKVIRVDEIQVVGQDGDGRRPAADGSGLEGHPVGALPGPSRQAR
jgi:uncharacterized radical SAM superfamily Fe-S cluster-containing enzyme